MDRADAGRQLGGVLKQQLSHTDALVLGLPRGGVPVAFEVARALGLNLDVLVVRKLGSPTQPEFAIGAVGPGGIVVLNQAMPRWLQHSSVLESETRREQAELLRRELLYRTGRPPLQLAGRDLIIVDDGAATGSSMLAAVMAARQSGARDIIAALPVATAGAAEKLRDSADRLICVHVPAYFDAVGAWYHDFDQISDQQVEALLAEAQRRERARPMSARE